MSKRQRIPATKAAARRERQATAERAQRRRRAWWAAAALAVAALIGLAVVASGGSGGGSGVSNPVAFDLPAIQGDTRVRLADFRGKPVVVNFFASWCTSCDFELPGFARVSEQLKGEVTFVGVNALETGDPMTMPRRHGITWWPLARDIGSRGNDLHAALGGRGMPITAFYDAAGKLVYVDPGALDEAHAARPHLLPLPDRRRGMTNRKAPARATTPPKGRATPKRDAGKRLHEQRYANWGLSGPWSRWSFSPWSWRWSRGVRAAMAHRPISRSAAEPSALVWTHSPLPTSVVIATARQAQPARWRWPRTFPSRLHSRRYVASGGVASGGWP